MNNLSRIIGAVLFLSLYLSAIVPVPFSTSKTTFSTENIFQKKQAQLSLVSDESIYSSIEVTSDNVQNAQNSGLKKIGGDQIINFKTVVSKEKSKFKQYLAIWHNQLIASRKTDQLYPHHTFG